MRTNYNKPFNNQNSEVVNPNLEVEQEDTRLKQENTETPPMPNPRETVYLKLKNCTLLNLRAEPNKDSDVLQVLNIDNPITLDAYIDDWAKIYTNNSTGFVMRQFIEEE